MEGRKASKLSSKISCAVDDFCVAHDLPTLDEASPAKGRKRRGSEEREAEVPAKAAKPTTDVSNGQQAGGFQAMTPEQIREIMNKTKKEIAQRMAQLNTAKESNQARLVGPQKPVESPKASLPPPGVAIPGGAAAAAGGGGGGGGGEGAGGAGDKAQTLAALQERIASSLNKIGDKLPVPARWVKTRGTTT